MIWTAKTIISALTRNEDGRYTVRLPFKCKPDSFGDIRQIAERMLRSTHRRFRRDFSFERLYVDFLEEYEKLGHMQRVDIPDEVDAYYLPHHGMLRESSLTTKLRVIFNGSQTSSVECSLNNCLHSGAKVQQDLLDVILRWRLSAYVFSADVEKMYRQILVHPADRKYQKIVWSRDPGQNPNTYELNTVTLLPTRGGQFPLGADVIRHNSYVDDVFGGADTENEAQEKARQVDQLLLSGGFRLQKWTCNCERILSSIEEARQLNIPKALDDTPYLRALGLSWSPLSDQLVFAFQRNIAVNDLPTKRSVLSFIARLYDPLGLMSPIIISAKIFLRTLWKTTLEWDDPLPSLLAAQWMTFISNINSSTTFLVPRWIGTRQTFRVKVHGFSDASQLALAAAVYFRVTNECAQTHASLVISKTKVAPLKQTTIPRLELSASVLLVQLVARTLKILNVAEPPIHLWVDSQIALTWITGNPGRWKDFVANRVALIQKTTPTATWHYVPGIENPADIASRGLTPHLLKDCDLWWTGPKWLIEPPSAWPSSVSELPVDTNLEERPIAVHTLTAAPAVWKLIDDYSSPYLLLRVTARVMLAARLFRSPADRRETLIFLIPRQIDDALEFWVRANQSAYFASELKLLRREEVLPRANDLSKLTPIVDQKGLLRVGGRLGAVLVEYDVKHPFILPRKSSLTTLLIRDTHHRTLHGGTQITLATLRQKFWIISGRVPVRSLIRKCVACIRQRGATLEQRMGQLLQPRIMPSRPFLKSGVDYAGLFHLRRVLGETLLTYKEFSSLLTQIEGVLNSRPLCALTDDPNDFSVLTPGYFLTGSALNTIPEPSLEEVPTSRLSR